MKVPEFDKTLEEGRRTYRLKRCGNNNKDEDNSPKTLNDKKRKGRLKERNKQRRDEKKKTTKQRKNKEQTNKMQVKRKKERKKGIEDAD